MDKLYIPYRLHPDTVVEIDDDKQHIDVAIYDQIYWKHNLMSHSAILLPFRYPLPQVTTPSVLSPNKAIWISSNEPSLQLPLRLLKLKSKILTDLATEMSEAKTCFKQGRLRKAKKRIINSIRYNFPLQRFTFQEIFDLQPKLSKTMEE